MSNDTNSSDEFGVPKGWIDTRPINKAKLPEKWIKHCVEMPESGMGYQKVNIKLNQGGVTKSVSGIVLNCSILETVAPVNVENIVEISLG